MIMATAWDMKDRNSRNKSVTDRTIDLLDIGFRGFKDTMNIVNELVDTNLFTNKKSSNCGCGCECESSAMDCCECGVLHAAVDIEIQARPGERRMVAFLIENNKSVPQDILLEVPIIIDACGNRLEGEKNFKFSPQKFVIPPCECQRVKLAIDLTAPFKECTSYYAEIRFVGNCIDQKICLGIYIEADNYVDHFTLTDHCRPKKGKFVEFTSCDICGCDNRTCGCCSKTKSYYICEKQKATATFSRKK